MDDRPRLRFAAGQMQVCGWPDGLVPPFGMERVGTTLQGPARLRWRLRQALDGAGMCYVDATADARRGGQPPVLGPDHDPGWLSAWSAGLRQAHYRGMLVGLGESQRMQLGSLLARSLGQAVLVVVTDTAAEDRMRDALALSRAGPACVVMTIARAAHAMHWLGQRHDAILVDAPERMPAASLEQALDASAALARIGTIQHPDPRALMRWAAHLGPLIGIVDDRGTPRCVELRVPLPEPSIAAYEEAWTTFLAAFDHYAAIRPNGGFGTFIAQARKDGRQRPAVHAWHEAVRLAAWHEHKSAVVDELLRRHRRERVLLFTPDRSSAYELARAHLVPAVTAELPRAERRALLRAFVDGTLPCLCGPRLLETGVAERSADVGILIGGGFGRSQRDARCRRVRQDGVVYEIVTQDTLEVGRAHRWRGVAADATNCLQQS